jgi:hypothetical protein
MRRRLAANAGWIALASWAACYLAVALVRPGFLLELAVAGCAGALAWHMLSGASLSPSRLALAGLAFLLPLVNTWPVRVYAAGLDRVSPWAAALFSVSSIAAIGVLALTRGEPGRGRPPLLLGLLAALALGGAAAGAAAAGDSSAAGAASWSAIAVAVLVGAAVIRIGADAHSARALLTAPVLAALVPASAGIAAYLSSFGLPRSVGDLTAGKIALHRQYLFQELTFGNVGHLADFALLLLPAGVLGLAWWRGRPLLQLASGVASAALAACLLLPLVRSGLAVGSATLLCVAAVALARGHRLAGVVAAGGAALFAAVLVAGQVDRGGDVPGGGRPHPGDFRVTVVDASAQFRLEALRAGLRVAREHLPWGVGTDQYLLHDPVHASPHSLAVAAVAEQGVAGGLALALLVAVLAGEGLRLARRRPPDEIALPALACLAGAAAYLVNAVGAGALLALGTANVWAGLLALQVALLVVLGRRQP